MRLFATLKTEFGANWTTVAVGWKGLGVLSPWPERWTEFEPMLSFDEIVEYGAQRLTVSSDPMEQDLIMNLLITGTHTPTREEISTLLAHLSDLNGANPQFELRKWRFVMLQELLNNLPKDPTYALIELSEFWQSFGFPSDSPHEIQGRQNSITTSAYYNEAKFHEMILRHEQWMIHEKTSLQHGVANAVASPRRSS